MSFNVYMVSVLMEKALAVMEKLTPNKTFKFKNFFYRPDMKFALELLKKNSFRPSVVVDVGAYKGEWAMLCKRVFPEANVLMVEPSPARVQFLDILCQRHKGLSVRQALVGAEEEKVFFNEQETNSSSVPKPLSNTIELTSKTLDALVKNTSFASPDLIKLDVQGYEFRVLKGMPQALRSVSVIVIELSLIQLSPYAPSFKDAVEWMDENGFKIFDICGFFRRPLDDALWQIDAVFVRKDSGFGDRTKGW